jgi:hypothetical protein
MSIPIRFTRIAASALLLLALDACGDDGAEDGTENDATSEASSGGMATDSTGADSTVADSAVDVGSGSESSGGMAAPGSCMQFPTIPAFGYVFVSDGADAGTCGGSPEPCGGDPFGEWTLASACGAVQDMPTNPFVGACPGADFEPEMPVRTGALSVEPGGAFELNTTTTYDYLFSADITCLGALDCGSDAEEIVTGITGGYVSCEGQVFACLCTVTGAVLESESSAGEGATGDRPLLVTDDGSIHPFCASEGQIAVWSLPVPPVYAGSCEVDDDCGTANDNQIAACIP